MENLLLQFNFDRRRRKKAEKRLLNLRCFAAGKNAYYCFLGPFALTYYLLDKVVASGKPRDPSRIIHVSSNLHLVAGNWREILYRMDAQDLTLQWSDNNLMLHTFLFLCENMLCTVCIPSAPVQSYLWNGLPLAKNLVKSPCRCKIS